MHEDTDGASAENVGWGVGLKLRYRPIEKLELSAGGGYREYNYANPHIRTGFSFDRRDETWHATAGLSYRVSERAKVGLHYNYIDKDSNIPASFAYEQNGVLLTLSVDGP